MPLSLSEKKEMTDLLSQIDHDTFRLLLAHDPAHLPSLSVFSSAVQPMPTVAFDFVYWLDLHPGALVPALTVILAEFGAADAAPALALARARLQAALVPGPPQPPWEVSLIKGIPVINRLRLRALLQDIAEDSGPSVVLVDGPAGTGRSHSWYLIDHVAKSSGNKLVKIDIDYLRPEGRNLEAIVNKLVSDLDLAFVHPSSVGATAETVGWRYADNLATALRKTVSLQATWFVFDSLEKHPLAEVRAFVATLIEMRLRMEVPNCVFFLLGAGPDYLPADDMGRIESDPVGIFSPGEIQHYVGILNQLGTRPLEAPKLVERASEITALLGLTPSDKVCRNIAVKIVALRKEVNA